MTVEPNMYDDEQLAQIRKDQEDPLVMYFVVRKDLEMSPGKIAAQVAHAAQMIIMKYYELKEDNLAYGLDDFKKCTAMGVWIKQSFRKVILKASDSEFNKLKESINCVVVRDAGLTEVSPNTETVLCAWPIKKSDSPKLLKRLRVL